MNRIDEATEGVMRTEEVAILADVCARVVARDEQRPPDYEPSYRTLDRPIQELFDSEPEFRSLVRALGMGNHPDLGPDRR
jgi:hypothetical protein